MLLAEQTLRIVAAIALIVAYGVFTARVARAHRRKNATSTSAATSHSAPRAPVLVAFASQTGYAEQVAWQTAQSLEAARVPMEVRPLSSVTQAQLDSVALALFIVSTTGEGDPPDSSLQFVHGVMNSAAALDNLGYGVLALGDSSYQNYCGFGRKLDAWLSHQSASRLFDRVDVDNADEHAIRQWMERVTHMTGPAAVLVEDEAAGSDAQAALAEVPGNAFATPGGTTSPPLWRAPERHPWRLARRELINPGSAGHPCFHLELAPPADLAPEWRAGDVAVIAAPDGKAREYSVASLPEDGALHLLVRQSRRGDGSLGIASGWLTANSELGSDILLHVRPNSNFHAPPATSPMILIGNGTGIAGLRAHLKARERAGARTNWLIFGERNAYADLFYRADIERWQHTGLLARTDLAFSRDQGDRIYVQHVLRAQAEVLKQWIADGAHVYICGSAQGMAPAVQEALAAALGEDVLIELMAKGRIRRDVY